MQQGEHSLDTDQKAHEADDRPEQAEIPGDDHHIDDLHDQKDEKCIQHLLNESADENQQKLWAVRANDVPEPTQVEPSGQLIAFTGFRWADQHQLQGAFAPLLQLRWAEFLDALRRVGQHQPARTRFFHQNKAIVELEQRRRFQPMQAVGGRSQRANLEAQAFQELTQMQQGDPTQSRFTVAQQLPCRFAREGEAVAVGEALQTDQCSFKTAFASSTHLGNAQGVVREPQAGWGDGIRKLLGVSGVLPERFRG